jgi:hypothetical protein
MYYSANIGSVLPTCSQLKTNINWLVGNSLTDESVLASSNLTSMTATSGGGSNISMLSTICSSIKDTSDMFSDFVSQKIYKTLITGMIFLVHSHHHNVITSFCICLTFV